MGCEMKDYKRLTDRVIAEMLRNTEGESWDSDNIEAQCYIRLAELEDKIESGEIDYVAYKDKEIARLTAENAELRATLSKMETVEKELRARLEKAVELPVKVGDTVYYLQLYCDYKGETVKHCSKKERPIMCECDEIAKRWSLPNWIYVIRERPFRLSDLSRIGKTVFLYCEEAEAKIAELKERRK